MKFAQIKITLTDRSYLMCLCNFPWHILIYWQIHFCYVMHHSFEGTFQNAKKCWIFRCFTSRKWLILRDKISISWRVWFEAIPFPILHKTRTRNNYKMCLTDSLFTANSKLVTQSFHKFAFLKNLKTLNAVKSFEKSFHNESKRQVNMYSLLV